MYWCKDYTNPASWMETADALSICLHFDCRAADENCSWLSLFTSQKLMNYVVFSALDCGTRHYAYQFPMFRSDKLLSSSGVKEF